MEEFGKLFPVHFKRNLTRKMNILSIVGPRQVREDPYFFKYLKLEQAIERAHVLLNKLEKRFENIKNQTEKNYLMIREFKIQQKADLNLMVTKHSFQKTNIIIND